MKALQHEIAWVEKQFFLAECKKLAAEQKRVEKLHKQLMKELKGLLTLENKIHSAISRRALAKVKQEVRGEINRIKHIGLSLREGEKHLKHHFAHDKQQVIKKEKEKLSLMNKGILVI